jgi:hypothetical protein
MSSHRQISYGPLIVGALVRRGFCTDEFNSLGILLGYYSLSQIDLAGVPVKYGVI